jgi:hypothetical protein
VPTRKTPDTPGIRLRAAASVVEAARGDDDSPKLPRFRMVANTGNPMLTAGWKFPVVVDFAGMTVPSQARPIRFNHDSDRGVGHTDRIAVEEGELIAEGVISRDTPEAREVVASGKNGFPWQASVGMSAEEVEFVKSDESVVVNARTFAGPLNVARRTTLSEISFVDLGADEATSAEIAASASSPSPTPPPASTKGTPVMTDQWITAAGFDPAAITDAQRATLKAAFDAANPATSTATATVAAGARPDPAATQSLDAIFAEQRREDQRVAEITRITAEALVDRPGMADELERMSRAAIEAKSGPQDYELAILRATRARPGTGGGFAVHRGDAKATAKTIEAALCVAGGLDDVEKRFDERTLEAASSRFRNGLGLCDAIHIAARENGWSGHSVKGDLEGALRAAFPTRHIQAQGWSTISLPTIFANTANKFLATGFNAVESTWREIGARRPVNDFKAITSATLTGGFTYEKVGPGGELKHATLGETTYTNQAETYGRMLSVTRQMIINDDLNALTGIPRKLGRGAAQALNRDFWTVFLNNSAFFTSGRGNYASGGGTALSIAGLSSAQALFRNQTDPDGEPSAITPRILLVPNALEVAAANLMNSVQLAGDTTANTVTFASNPFAGRFQVAQSSYLSNPNYTGYSTTAYYLLADPDDMPVIEVVFLNGKEVPTVEQAEADFNVLGIQFRGVLDYGVNLHEYRGGVKMAGA